MVKVIKINRKSSTETCTTDLVFVDMIEMIKKEHLQLSKSHIRLILTSGREIDIAINTGELDVLYDEIENFILYSKESKLEFTIFNK